MQTCIIHSLNGQHKIILEANRDYAVSFFYWVGCQKPNFDYRMNSGAWLGCEKSNLGCGMNIAAYIFILSTLPSCGMSFIEPQRYEKHRSSSVFH